MKMEGTDSQAAERTSDSTNQSDVSFIYSDSLGSWLVTMLLFSIPVVNLIYFVVLLLGFGGSVAKVNMARATLIWVVIAMAAYFFLFASFFLYQ